MKMCMALTAVRCSLTAWSGVHIQHFSRALQGWNVMAAAHIVPGPTARFSIKTPWLPWQFPSRYGIQNKGSHQFNCFRQKRSALQQRLVRALGRTCLSTCNTDAAICGIHGFRQEACTSCKCMMVSFETAVFAVTILRRKIHLIVNTVPRNIGMQPCFDSNITLA